MTERIKRKEELRELISIKTKMYLLEGNKITILKPGFAYGYRPFDYENSELEMIYDYQYFLSTDN